MNIDKLEKAKQLEVSIDEVTRFLESRKSNWNGKLMLVNEMSCHASANSRYRINREIEIKIADILKEYKHELENRLDAL